MKPVGAGQQFLPFQIGRIDPGNGAVGAVIGDGRGPLRGAGFQKVDSDAVAAAQDRARIDPESAQALDRRLGHVVFRQARDESRLLAEEGQRHGHVGLAAAKGHLQRGGLAQAQVARCRQAQHDFSKSYHFHGRSGPFPVHGFNRDAKNDSENGGVVLHVFPAGHKIVKK